MQYLQYLCQYLPWFCNKVFVKLDHLDMRGNHNCNIYNICANIYHGFAIKFLSNWIAWTWEVIVIIVSIILFLIVIIILLIVIIFTSIGNMWWCKNMWWDFSQGRCRFSRRVGDWLLQVYCLIWWYNITIVTVQFYFNIRDRSSTN